MSIKYETTANEQMAEGHSPQSLSAPIVKEQSNQDLLNSDEDDEEECDSDECVYGIEITDEGEDVQKLSPPVKKPRLNHPTQPNKSSIIGESSRQAQANNQMNTQTDKQYITLSVHCPELDCLKMCAEGELNDHLKEEHSIGPSRCLVKDCAGQSFDSRRILARHIKQTHQHTTQWNCGICPKHYPTYNLLYNHDHQQHQLGQFQCSFPACTFTGETRMRMYSHYAQEHKPTLSCPHFGCQYRTQRTYNLKQHQRTHTRIKPFLCKWPKCDYAGSQQPDTIRHIRAHFAKLYPLPTGAQEIDPKVYLEVVHELL